MIAFDHQGYTSLMRFAESGHIDDVNEVLDSFEAFETFDQDIAINARNHSGETALILAIKMGHSAIAEVLIRHGANVNLSDFDCYTPLILAAQGDGDAEIVKWLLDHGAAVELRNCLGETALHKAAYFGHDKIASLLIEGGAEVGARDLKGETPLHKTMVYGWDSMVELLLLSGAEVGILDKAGESALQKAVHRQWKSIAIMLLAHGAEDSAIQDIESVERIESKNLRSRLTTYKDDKILEKAIAYRDFLSALKKF